MAVAVAVLVGSAEVLAVAAAASFVSGFDEDDFSTFDSSAVMNKQSDLNHGY